MTKKLFLTPKHWLTLDDSKTLFDTFREQMGENEPIPRYETRFPGKLEGILESVRQSFDDRYLNTTVLDAAASYFNHIIRGHPFRNGNKRMGVLFTHYFLLTHDVDLTLEYNELFSFAILVARAGERGVKPELTKIWCSEIIKEFSEDKR